MGRRCVHDTALSLVSTFILLAGSLQKTLDKVSGGSSKVEEEFGVLEISV